MYYRYTHNSDTAMSDWGHAMFADKVDHIGDGYGPFAWVYGGEGAVAISSLHDAIVAAWAAEVEQYNDRGCYFGRNGEDLTYELDNLDAETVFDSFNPDRIVDSADGWDSDLMIWLYHTVLEPAEIVAVTTCDGAIVFDRNLIRRDEANDR